MWDYSVENIPQKYRASFMTLVRYSFGYGNSKTMHKPIDYWAEKIGLSRNTCMTHLSYLVQNKHVKQIKDSRFVVGGGKHPYSYAPVFSKKAKIWIRKTKKPEKKFDAWDKKNDTITTKKEKMDEALKKYRDRGN